MDELLPYPWTTSDGLCEALRHPMFLAEAYVAPAVRRLIKKALKAARLGWGSAPQIIDVSDDDRFEVALVECLAEASRRRAFFKSLLGMLRQSKPSVTHAGGYLAWNVIESLLHDYRVANRLFLGREVLSPGWYWTPDWNPEWLQQKLQQFTSRYHPDSRRWNVQLVAALAMWLPSHALSFYRVLCEWDPQARPLLLDAPMDESLSAAPPIGTQLPGAESFAPTEESEEAAPAVDGIRDSPVSEDASERLPVPVIVQQILPAELAQRPAAAPVLADVAGQDGSSRRDSIPQAEPGRRRDNLLEVELRALVQDGGWAESLPEDRLRELATQLDKVTRAVSGQLDEVERHRQSVRSRLPELLGRLPFSLHLTVAGLMEPETTLGLGAVRTHLIALRQQVEDIISEEQRVATLASRLECPRAAWPLPSGMPSLALMLDALRSATKDFSESLAALERREQDVAAFLVNLYDSKRSYGELSADRLRETLHFALSDRSPSAVLKPFLPLRQESETVAVLVALLVRMDSAAAARQLHSAAQQRSGALSWPWLALLSFAQMQELVHQCQALASPVSFILFEFALAVDRVDVLEYIGPLLDGPSLTLTAARFYREVISYGRIQASLARLLALRPATTAGLQPVRQDLQAKVLEFLERPPGMEGIFHHLRSIGYREYLLPLLITARTGDAAATLLQFDSAGGISAIVNRCIELSGKRRDVETRHEQQTCNYLEECRQLLSAWADQQAAALTAGPAVDPAHRLLDEHLPMLQREADSDPSIARLLNLLSRSGQGRSAGSLPPENFGLGCDTVGDEPTLPNDYAILPELTDSFDVRFRQQPVPLRVYLGDSIRQLRTPRTRRAAIDDLLERQSFQAALSAASDKEQEDLVRQAAQRQEAHIREGYAEEIRHAEVLRGADTMLDEILSEVSEAFAQMEFGEARSYLELLPNEIKRCRLERDPVRNAALEFLREAGQPPPADASIQEMTARVDQLKQEFEDCRWHIVELERILQHDKLATELRDACGALARRIDRPALWPKTKISVQLADDMEICKKFIVQRVQYEEDPHAVEFLQGRLARWIPALLTESLTEPESKCTQLLAPLTTLAQEIRNLCPLRRVNELVSVQLASRETERHPRSRSLSTLLQRRGAAGEPGQQGGGYQDGILIEVVTSLRAEMDREAPLNDTSRKALYDALREANWQNVRYIAAALRHSEGGSGLAEGMSVDPLMALFGVASVFSIQESSPEDLGHRLRWACIAALVCRELRHELVQAQLTYDRLLVDMIVAACRKLTKAAVSSDSQRMEVMSVVAESSPSDPAYVWLSQVLWNAAQLRIGEHASSLRLASALWDGYTNVEGSDIGRGKLLYLLYRLRRGEALRALASRTRDMENLITGCITAFERAEADVELLPGAYQLAAAYRQQAGSKANTRPWSWLFVKLTSLRHGAEGSGLHCDVDSDIVEVDPAGEPLATVNLRLAPASVHDPVVRLAIEFDETNLTYNLMEDGQYLLRERLVSVTIPLPQGVAEGDVLKLPYRLLGQTLGGSVLDMRDSLTVHVSQRMYTKLAEETILSEWPGATGNPVTDKSFHGRQHEIKLIDSYIRVNTRPQSVMLFGQRRIGKTSLLQEIVRHLPPVAGNICGAFVDVSGLNLPPGASVGKALFDHIIGALDAAPSNAPLRRTLQDHGMKEFARLAKGLHPEQSLAHALERLREEIERATSGTIARIALCIDEFDRFVEPLLRGEREAIEGLMWNLRQIIQTSESISLVLAGSGLQRVFTSGYAQPLYGSIEEVHLKAFDWNVDQEAVQQTFLPAQVRAKICELKHLPDVSQRAYDLCGGHPYYLSLLGYAAAAFSKGRPLTPHMISRAAELMLRGELFASQRHIDAKRFYDHVFETLRALPQRELGLARILLAHIAERTTPEFPWLTLGEAIEVPELLAISSEQERQQALRRLESEQVLEEDTSHRTPRFRIRVPLTADAVRLDSVLLREQGTSEVKTALRQLG